MSEEKEETMIVTIPARQPPKKRYWKIHDFFIREWNWPEQMLKYPGEKVNLKLDYKLPFNESLKKIKKKFNLSDSEIESFKNYELEFDILRLEKTEYKDKKIISQIYKAVFNKDHLRLFLDNTEYIVKQIEEFDKDYKINDEEGNFVYHAHRALINLLLGISFEYICKALLISKDYKINEYENGKEPTKKSDKEIKFNPTRTINIDILWDFIKKENFIQLSDEEKMIGNYLCFLRNVQAHIPLPPASRGNYTKLALNLINKIRKETKKEYFYYLGGAK